MKTYLIAGLGNPGEQYENTRHNVGFMCIDYLAQKWCVPEFSHKSKFHAEMTDVTLQTHKTILAKPQTYMNDSGRAVSAIAHFYNTQPQNIVVIHDDLDITFGDCKIQFGKGPKIHNGLISIEEHLTSAEFWRVRIGVDGRSPETTKETKQTGKNYVLGKFTTDEIALLKELFGGINKEMLKIFATK